MMVETSEEIAIKDDSIILSVTEPAVGYGLDEALVLVSYSKGIVFK